MRSLSVTYCKSTHQLYLWVWYIVPHSAALLATQMLPFISRGDMYKQLEWVILDAHANLLDLLASSQAGNEKLIVQRCERLSALIVHSTIPQNDQLLALQEKVNPGENFKCREIQGGWLLKEIIEFVYMNYWWRVIILLDQVLLYSVEIYLEKYLLLIFIWHHIPYIFA